MSGGVIACPDIGNFSDVLVIDVLVKAGDAIAVDAPLVTLETEKATMDVPSTLAGVVAEVLVAKGSRVSQGTPLLRMQAAASQGSRNSIDRRLMDAAGIAGHPGVGAVTDVRRRSGSMQCAAHGKIEPSPPGCPSLRLPSGAAEMPRVRCAHARSSHAPSPGPLNPRRQCPRPT